MFAYDGPVYRFMKKIMDVTILHLLWLLTSLPIVTLGASTTALYGVSMMRRMGDESESMSKQFFSVFRRCWKQGTLMLLGILGMAGLLAVNLYFWNNVATGIMANCMAVVCLAMLVPLALLAIYGFAVIARKGGSTWQCAKTALWAAYAHPLCSLKLGFFWALAVVANVSTLYANVLFAMIGFGAFVHIFLSRTLLTAIDEKKAAEIV